MTYRIYRRIRTPEDLGTACLGDPRAIIAPVSPEHRIDRAEYGRKLAELECGVFTPLGYIVPAKKAEGGKQMPHEYTRQRQGRDFSLHNYLQNAEMSVEGNYNNIDGIINGEPKEDETKKTLLDRLEQFKAEAERNAVPVDGHEPAQEHPAPERWR